MNERIKELADRAELTIRTSKGTYMSHPEFNKMFAELIVQEMLRLLEQYSRDSFPKDIIDNFDKGYLAGLHTAQKAVKKHFGVEE